MPTRHREECLMIAIIPARKGSTGLPDKNIMPLAGKPLMAYSIEAAIKKNKPVVIDVHMKNIPTPTAGHWNIMDIYSPGRKVHHVATDK